MFDVDGTLIDSYDLDSACFIEAVEEVSGIQLDPDWSGYRHVTDSGILNEVLGSIQSGEADRIKNEIRLIFIEKLRRSIRDHPIREIPGAASFIASLKERDDLLVSIATGGWRESALLKLSSAGIDISSFPLATSSDRVSRVEIMRYAEQQATGGKAMPCIYFGDAWWDREACGQLGYSFVLVGNKFTHTPAIQSYRSAEDVLALLGSHRKGRFRT